MKKIAASETRQEYVRQTNATISNELKSKSEGLEKMSINCSRLRDRNLQLSREVRRLRRKASRVPGQRSHAIEVAIAKSADKLKTHYNTLRIKRPDGRIENWVRDLTCRLIARRHLPATQAPGAISDILWAVKSKTGDNNGGDVGTFSDRSARRFPLEGYIMGKIQVAQDFKAAPG